MTASELELGPELLPDRCPRCGQAVRGALIPTWEELEEFPGPIDATDQIVIVSPTNGGKSTLAATLTLRTPSLVVVNDKAPFELPRSRTVELPWFGPERIVRGVYPPGSPEFQDALRDALAIQQVNRVILTVAATDVERPEPHDAIARAIYERGDTFWWYDEISATGNDAWRTTPYTRALSARGRTKGLGGVALSQSAFGLLPGILKRNAKYIVVGPLEPADARDIPRQWIEIALELPPSSGRFLVYAQGRRAPWRLYRPIPTELRAWTAP